VKTIKCADVLQYFHLRLSTLEWHHQVHLYTPCSKTYCCRKKVEISPIQKSKWVQIVPATQDICYTFLIVSRKVLHQVNLSKIHPSNSFYSHSCMLVHICSQKTWNPTVIFIHKLWISNKNSPCVHMEQPVKLLPILDWQYSASVCHGAPHLFWLEACLISWNHISITLVLTNWPQMMI
jgi:hypothetical protein